MSPGSENAPNGAAPDAIRRRGSHGQPPSWVILPSAALVALGFIARQRPAATSPRGNPAATAAAPGAGPRPSRGSWKDILLRVYAGISDDRILLIAAGVTFYEILALFPGIGAMVSVYGLFADPSRIAAHLDTLVGLAPGGAIDVLREQLIRFPSRPKAVLSFGFAVSMGISLWSANAGVSRALRCHYLCL